MERALGREVGTPVLALPQKGQLHFSEPQRLGNEVADPSNGLSLKCEILGRASTPHFEDLYLLKKIFFNNIESLHYFYSINLN